MLRRSDDWRSLRRANGLAGYQPTDWLAPRLRLLGRPAGYVSFHGARYSRRRNSFGSVTVPPDPLIVLVTRMLAPS